MKIYFAAHATTTDNEAKIASGWKDIELSELGIKQAHELGEIFKDIKLDLVCTSDLKRAVDSVKIAFGEKYPILIDARLRELNYGDFNGKPSEVVEKMKIERIKKSKFNCSRRRTQSNPIRTRFDGRKKARRITLGKIQLATVLGI